MFKMIKLDWLGMKCYWLRIILLPVIILIYGFFNEALIIPIISFMMLSFSVNPFAVEEKGKLDNLYLTLPVTRKTIVNTRYTLSLIMQLAGIFFGVIMTFVMATILDGKNIIYQHSFSVDIQTLSLLVCGSLVIYSIMNLSMFPILFKIGYAKGKSIGFYSPIFAATVIFLALYFTWYLNDAFRQFLLNAVNWSYNHPLYISGILLFLAFSF